MFNNYQTELNSLEKQLKSLNNKLIKYQGDISTENVLIEHRESLDKIIEDLGIRLTESDADFIIGRSGTTKQAQFSPAINTTNFFFELSNKFFGDKEEPTSPEELLNEKISERKEVINRLIKVEEAKNELPSIQEDINALNNKIVPTRVKSNEVDYLIGDLISQYDIKVSDISNIEKEIADLKSLKQKLETSDKNDKYQAHVACEEKYGSQDPNYLLRNKSKNLKKLMRDKRKITNRIQDKLFIYEANIKKLIIDGNNLCYVANKFVGLKYLKALIDELVPKYSIDIIFDPGITNMLKMSQDDVSKKLTNQGVDCYFVAKGEFADDFILMQANNSSNNFIISNDNFTDFITDFSEVINRRLIRHMLTKTSIIISKLDINIKLS